MEGVMRLTAFRVQKFRNIIDSEEVVVEPDVTSLVGKNEGGKTAALNALYRLNAAYGEEFEVSEHYPRWLLTADRKAGAIGDADTITGSFELEDDDVAAVEAQFGQGVLKDKTFSYTRGYESRRANVKLDEAVALSHFLATSEATQATKD